MRLANLLVTVLSLLLVTIARSEDADVRPELEDKNLRHLHQDDQRVRQNDTTARGASSFSDENFAAELQNAKQKRIVLSPGANA
jgi:hypothetical protein